MTITFMTDGTARCLYGETIDLKQLGLLKITRASTIEFDEQDQLWKVKVSGTTMFASDSRQICLDWEQKYFN